MAAEHGEEFFNSMASKWDERPEVLETSKHVFDNIMKHLKGTDLSDLRVVEIGAGTGNVAIPIAKQVASYVAVDTSDKMLSVLTQKAKDADISVVETINKAVESTEDLGGRTFDVAIVVMTLHHVKDAQKLMNVLAESLNVGGHLFVFDLEYTDDACDFHSHVDHEAASVHHAGGFTAKQMCEMMEEAGLVAKHAKSEFKMKKVPMEHDEHHHHHHHHDKAEGDQVQHHGMHRHHHKPESKDEDKVEEFNILCAVGNKAA